MLPLPQESDVPSNEAPTALTLALDKSEKIQNIVEQCADELSSVNLKLKNELDTHPSQPGAQNALRRSELIEGKVQECADDLIIVNQALEEEVKERQAIEKDLIEMRIEGDAARHEALHDPLTKLPNRFLFSDRLEHGLIQAKRHGWSLAVMFIDLDKFKSINDMYGHAAGDVVLQTVSRRLSDVTRGQDTVSRQGGDEFLLVLLEMKDEAAAAAIAEKIIRAVGQPCSIEDNGNSKIINIELSIGIAMYPQDGETGTDLVARADKAMYDAKKSTVRFAFTQRGGS